MDEENKRDVSRIDLADGAEMILRERESGEGLTLIVRMKDPRVPPAFMVPCVFHLEPEAIGKLGGVLVGYRINKGLKALGDAVKQAMDEDPD